MKFSIVLVTLFISLSECGNQVEQEPKMVYVEQLKWHPASFDKEVENESLGYKIKDALPSGYVKDGSVDYTFHIQDAIDRYDVLEFPGFPLLINDSGLKIGSNKTITFLKGSELRLDATDKGNYAVIDVRNAENVKLINPVIVGDRDIHLGTKGEWGMGIRIVSSRNVEVLNPKISKCWGDGLYIAGSSEEGPSKNITVVNAYCKNNRRNGISVISVNGLKLISPYSGYNDGTDPKSGIDIEPNRPEDEIKNITIVNPQTEYNPGTGISIAINKLYGNGDQQVSVDVQKHVDYGSLSAFLISCSTKKSKAGESVTGTINISDPVWKYNAKASLSVYKFREPALFLNVTNAHVTDTAGKDLTKEAFNKTVQATIGSTSRYELK